MQFSKIKKCFLYETLFDCDFFMIQQVAKLKNSTKQRKSPFCQKKMPIKNIMGNNIIFVCINNRD